MAWYANQKDSSIDDTCLHSLLTGAVHAQLGNDQIAEQYFLALEDKKKGLKNEKWVVPFARYELAMLWTRQRGPADKKARDMLKKALSYNAEYDFQSRLELRCHMVCLQSPICAHEHSPFSPTSPPYPCPQALTQLDQMVKDEKKK